MSTKKSTRSSQSSGQLVLEKPDAALIAKNHYLKQTTVCDKLTSAPKQTTQQSVIPTEVQHQRPSRLPTVPQPSNVCTTSNPPIMSNEDIEKLLKKISNLEKVVNRIDNSMTVNRIKDNTPISAQSKEKTSPDIVPAKVCSLAPTRLKEILYENRDNEDVNQKLGLEDFGEYKSQRRILLNLWIRNIFSVYLYDSKLANFTDKAVNEARVLQVIDRIADALFTCLDKMDIPNTSYEVIRANFRTKVSFIYYFQKI